MRLCLRVFCILNEERLKRNKELLFQGCRNKLPLSGLKQHTFIILQTVGQNCDPDLNGLKSRCWQTCVPSRGSRGISISLLLLCSLDWPTFLCLWPPFSTAKPVMLYLSDQSSVVISMSDHSQEMSSTFKDRCDDIGPTHIIQDSFLISRPSTSSHLQSPFYHVR